MYYNQKDIITQESVIVPVWFKIGAEPKYICYCSKVTELSIIDAVKTNNACNVKDIIRITGAMKNRRCETENPTGNCCAPYIQEILTNHHKTEKG